MRSRRSGAPAAPAPASSGSDPIRRGSDCPARRGRPAGCSSRPVSGLLASPPPPAAACLRSPAHFLLPSLHTSPPAPAATQWARASHSSPRNSVRAVTPPRLPSLGGVLASVCCAPSSPARPRLAACLMGRASQCSLLHHRPDHGPGQPAARVVRALAPLPPLHQPPHSPEITHDAITL